MEEVRDINRTFSHEELDLINEFTKIHQGVTDIDELGFLTMDSELVRASFRVSRHKEKRVVKGCVVTFGCFNPSVSRYPSDLKLNLGL
jgi:hypothetical protein